MKNWLCICRQLKPGLHRGGKMNAYRSTAVFAVASLLIVASVEAQAQQPAVSPPPGAAASDSGLEEIIVTARRKEESLQDVPESLNAVTAQQIQDYNIVNFSDLNKLVPGFTANENGFGNGITLRGINSPASNVPPTAVEYLNEGPVDPVLLFQSTYDIGQIEVLRGPQGTIRGKIGETGAITFNTRQPDLEEMGGYASTTVASLNASNVQGAISFPIIPGKLAVRIAGNHDETAYNDVYSLNNPSAPSDTRTAGRITVKFVPTDSFDGVISYQHAYRLEKYYNNELAGPGNGIDGPAISPNARLTVEPGQSRVAAPVDDIEGTLNLTLFGQKLTYVGSYYKYDQHIYSDGNNTNADPGITQIAYTDSVRSENSSDVRVSSAQPLFHGYFDYVAGFFYDEISTPTAANAGYIFLPGALGNRATPGYPIPGLPLNYSDIIPEVYNINPQKQLENAVYANGTIHIDANDEISGGVRYGREFHHSISTISIGPPLNIVLHEPGSNDIATYYPTIYNVEASHRFNPELLVYFRTGSSFRYGAINPALAPFTGGNPAFAPYLQPAPERLKDYEGGFKGDLFDRRLTFDVDYFYIDFSSFFYPTASAWHLQYSGTTPSAVHSPLGSIDLPAKVQGVEANVAAKITNQWTAIGSLAFSHGRVNGTAPCEPPGLGPQSSPAAALAALQAAGVVTFTCPGVRDATLRAPAFTFNVESEYDQPINADVSAFARGLVNYNSSNSLTGIVGFTSAAYATVDLYLGLRHPDGQWEVSLFAKNLNNSQAIISNGSPATTAGTLGNTFQPNGSGYDTVMTILPRQYGVTARYAFGSR
jgi:iron complex outermembrane receptor protein